MYGVAERASNQTAENCRSVQDRETAYHMSGTPYNQVSMQVFCVSIIIIERYVWWELLISFPRDIHCGQEMPDVSSSSIHHCWADSQNSSWRQLSLVGTPCRIYWLLCIPAECLSIPTVSKETKLIGPFYLGNGQFHDVDSPKDPALEAARSFTLHKRRVGSDAWMEELHMHCYTQEHATLALLIFNIVYE